MAEPTLHCGYVLCLHAIRQKALYIGVLLSSNIYKTCKLLYLEKIKQFLLLCVSHILLEYKRL